MNRFFFKGVSWGGSVQIALVAAAQAWMNVIVMVMVMVMYGADHGEPIHFRKMKILDPVIA